MKSNKAFGISIGVLLIFISIYLYLNNNLISSEILASMALVFILTGFFKPNIFNNANKLWKDLGYKIGDYTNPIIMGFLYFFFLTPLALILRISRRDPLAINIKSKKMDTYWIDMSEKIYDKEYFKNQY